MAAEPHPDWASKLSAPEIRVPTGVHVVQFYDDDAYLVDLVARFLGVGLVAGDALVAFATERHRKAICDRLAGVGFDLDEARETRQVHFHDAEQTLGRLLIGGTPNQTLFRAVVGGILEDAAGTSRRRVRIFGEMVDLRWCKGDVVSAIRLEEFWNALQREHPVELLLAYSKGNEYREAHFAGAAEAGSDAGPRSAHLH